MNKCIVVLLAMLMVLVAKGQNLIVEGTAPDLYLKHTVAPKENFYSIGRLYNQAPKLIAGYNSLLMEKGLSIGQQVKVPLTAQNYGSSLESTGIPLTHIILKSETLFRIGANHHVDVQAIKRWNSLSSDNITPGAPLIVGYLKTTEPIINVGTVSNTPLPVAQPNAGTKPAEAKIPAEVSEPAGEAAPKNDELFTSVGDVPTKTPEPNVEKFPARMDTATPQPVSRQENVAVVASAGPNQRTVKMAELPGTFESAPPTIKKSPEATVPNSPAEGNFSDIFSRTAKGKSASNRNGDAATFKTKSGWQDKKYYVLINDIAPGTIVKVAAPNNKYVYAKVLGSMPEMKENSGLLLRISNAAASYFGIIDPKFPVEVLYYQ